MHSLPRQNIHFPCQRGLMFNPTPAWTPIIFEAVSSFPMPLRSGTSRVVCVSGGSVGACKHQAEVARGTDVPTTRVYAQRLTRA